MKRGTLFIISGPSGVGKGTIVREILKQKDGQVRLSISATTRAMREGDRDGVDYYFLSEEKFNDLIREDGFLEYARVHEKFYGTPKSPVEEYLQEGLDVFLEIDVQGSMKVREKAPEAVCIFILPPSIPVLRKRLEDRGTESAEQVNKRMSKAMGEIEYLDRYDYAVVNDALHQAVLDTLCIMEASRLHTGDDTADIIEQYRKEVSALEEV